jgi:catechol 2,3-dioxygenase-like lactoylglutathione lyase family enzyme
MADFLVLTLDCLDLDRQSAFWCAALGYREAEGVAQYRPLVHPDRTVPKLLLQRVDDVKSGKNRLHLDLHVADPASEAQRLEALGATRVERVDEFGIHWFVMNDPEGNEFCLVVDRGVTAQPFT